MHTTAPAQPTAQPAYKAGHWVATIPTAAAQPTPCRKRGTLAGGSWLSPTVRLAIYLRDEFACAYCGANLHHATPFNVTLDHLVARSAAGGQPSHCPTNLVTACRSCNSKRGATPWRQYATGGARRRIAGLVRRKLPLALAKAIITGQAPSPRVVQPTAQ